MDWKKIIGFGLLLWVILFAFVSALAGFKVYGNIWGKMITIAVAAVLAFLFAKNIKPATVAKALGLGIIWVAVAAILDFFITIRFEPNLFKMRSLWVGYAVILLAPLAFRLMQKKSPPVVTQI